MSTPEGAAAEAPGIGTAESSPANRQAAKQGPAIPPKPSLRALIIGYGSPIRGDDALGPLVADRLQEWLNGAISPEPAGDTQDYTDRSSEPNPVADIEVQSRHILTAELVEDLARARLVVFVDAAIDTPPGEVRRRRLTPDRSALSTMAHFHDPRELLAWCEALYQHSPEAWLVSGGGANWDYSCYALSETAQQAFEPMLAEVMSLISPEAPQARPPANRTARS